MRLNAKFPITIALGFGLIWLSSCTVTPRPVVDGMPSFDGAVQNSGFLGFDPAGRGILTPHARDRYNRLVVEYGARYLPPLVLDAGVTPTATNTFLLDPEHLVDFAEMNRWRKAQPPKP